MQIDGDNRKINARNHSAGHLIDIGVFSTGLEIIPTKGYHFRDAPYVEYEGKIDKS